RDRDAAEAEPAQQPVGRGLERGSAPAEAAVEGVVDHHARNAGANGGSEPGELARAQDGVDVRGVVGRDAGRPEAGKVLGAGGLAARLEPPGERDAVRRPPELTRTERAV